MVRELMYNVDLMPVDDLEIMVKDLKSRKEISLDERIKLFYGLLRMNCLDSAIFQAQTMFNYLKEKSILKEFLAKYPELQISFMAEYKYNPNTDSFENVNNSSGCCEMAACGCCCILAPVCCPGCWDVDNGICCNMEDGGCCGSCCESCCYSAFPMCAPNY